MAELNFSKQDYKEVAKRVIKIVDVDYSKTLSKEDAFCLLIKNVKEEDISNLVNEISKELSIKSNAAFEMIQEPKSNEEKTLIFNTAIRMIKNNITLGNKIVPNTNINSSSWISHSLYEGIVASELASMLNLNSEFAFTYGLLHDIGRKYSNNFTHVIKGFETLVDEGHYVESKAALTHSFINGGRYNNNEKVTEYMRDDIDEILSYSVYNDYDNILNISDLMATSYGIVSPLERINDISTRRKNIDLSPNRKAFFISFYNLLAYFLNKAKNLNLKYIENKELNLEEIKKKFDLMSEKFYIRYLDYVNNKDNNLKK